MSENLPADQAAVLRALYEWRYGGRGRGPTRSPGLEDVPDYLLEAELKGQGIDVQSRLEILKDLGLVYFVKRGDVGGAWMLADGRLIRSMVGIPGQKRPPLPASLPAPDCSHEPMNDYQAVVEVRNSAGEWDLITWRCSPVGPCGQVFNLTPKGIHAVQASFARDPGAAELTLDDLVTLDQAAAVVQRSKRSLEKYLAEGKLPNPDMVGGGGKPHRWYWSHLKPSLERHFRPNLPDRFPGSRII